MLRILHTGDLHLDSPFRGLTPEKARLRREEQRTLLERIRALAEERQVDVVLIAGDLFDGDSVYYETTRMLVDTFAAMSAKIFIAPGNHDPFSEYSPYVSVRWPENVHVFRSEYFQRVALPEHNAVLYGTAFTSKYRDNSPLDQFKGDYDEGMARVMLLHGDLSAGRSRYGAISEAAIVATGMDYVALGHVHRHQGFGRKGNTTYAYCGCPEGRGFDETGEKGVIIGEIAPGEVKLEFVPICQRRYEEVGVDITGKEPEAALMDALPADSEKHIFRFRLTGERLGDAPDTRALTALLADKFFDVQVADDSVPAMDLWERLEEDTLTGLFLRNMKKRLDTAAPEERALLERAARYGLAALEGREEPR